MVDEPDQPDGPDDKDEDDEAEQRFQIVVDATQAGGRLDAVIAASPGVTDPGGPAQPERPALSRTQVQRLIEEGRVTMGSAVATKSTRLKAGDVIDVVVPAPEPLEVSPEPISLAILFEDPDLIVIDKPAGLVVHPAAGHTSGTLVNALLYHCKDLSGIGGVLRPGIVHRLDKDTSGVMVVAKSERAHAALTAGFAAKTIGRTYLGIASPPPPVRAGTLRTSYGRHPVHRKKFSSKVAAGKQAVTHWEVVESLHAAALVRFRLETGRTHQIRVHASDHGWPLVGDPVYGHKPADARVASVAQELGRQALHAATLAFEHPVSGGQLSFDATLPEDMQRALIALDVHS